MTKTEKAKEVIKTAAKLGVQVCLQGNWVTFEPASKVPASLILSTVDCSNEIASILREAKEKEEA